MNMEWLAKLPAGARRTVYFSLQKGLGSKVAACWNEMLRWQQFSAAELEERVSQHLERLLHHAVSTSVYYRGLGLVRRPGERPTEFLRRFPVLNRETVRQQFAHLVTDSLTREIISPESKCSKGYGWLVVKTGGTTGTPTSVVHDAVFRDWGRASRLYSSFLCGFGLGTSYFKLWGAEEDLFQQKRKLHLRVMQALLAEIPMNAFRTREADLELHYQTLCRHPQVNHLMAYADSAVLLADFIDNKKLRPRHLKTIMSCAGTLTAEYRTTLEEAFQAAVFDKYGSRDCSEIACECSVHQGLHIFSPQVFVEILDDQGVPVPEGQCGNIIVTLLNNHAFPMIRYQIGDLGVLAKNSPCPCGLPFPKLERIEGRKDDMLFTEEGRKVTSLFVRHFVGVTANRQLIQEWQLEQIDPRHCIFRYVAPHQEGLAANLEQLTQCFNRVLGNSIRIEHRAVEQIPLSPTGKRRWIVNRSLQTTSSS